MKCQIVITSRNKLPEKCTRKAISWRQDPVLKGSTRVKICEVHARAIDRGRTPRPSPQPEGGR